MRAIPPVKSECVASIQLESVGSFFQRRLLQYRAPLTHRVLKCISLLVQAPRALPRRIAPLWIKPNSAQRLRKARAIAGGYRNAAIMGPNNTRLFPVEIAYEDDRPACCKYSIQLAWNNKPLKRRQ